MSVQAADALMAVFGFERATLRGDDESGKTAAHGLLEVVMSNKMREEFEEWFSYNYKWFIEKDMGGYSLARFPEGQMQYIDQIPHHDWRVWQASRAALVVELPDPHSTNGGDCVIDYDECRDAIHAAGVKTK